MKSIFQQKLFNASVSSTLSLRSKLESRFGKFASYLVLKTIELMERITPAAIANILPPVITAFFINVNLGNIKNSQKFYSWLKVAKKSYTYKKFSIFSEANFKLLKSDIESVYKFIAKVYNQGEEAKKYASQWMFFNLNQKYNLIYFTKMKKDLEISENRSEINESSIRYLPDHTKHMGHLGYLFLYGNYYGKIDKDRTVCIWPNFAPNSFYLNEVLKHFPLKINLLQDLNSLNTLHPNRVDSIFLSRVKENKWRFEPIVSAGSGQEFPEFNIESSKYLKSDPNISDEVIEQLELIGFNPSKWFVILHIKEAKVGYKYFAESRDADILTYDLACKLIVDYGGQVIRMGSNQFPNLPSNFPAIDYANSAIRSEKVDYWLWSNCRFWIGNGNGASTAVIPFGKQRILSNHWPYNPNGPSQDVIIPKLIFDKSNSTFLNFQETVDSPIGNVYDKSKIEGMNYKIIDNTPEVIFQTVLEVLMESNYANSNPEIDELFYAATNTPLSTPRMILSQSFKKIILEGM
jgi:putative glycosyltransferase (TIGR04372 family)